jgi:deoxyribodipyrimidine photo-lyase
MQARRLERSVAALRISAVNAAHVRRRGEYVLYWMIAARRTTHNFALDRALRWARDLERPLVVLEPLRCGYRWASDRLHAFVLQGMSDNARELSRENVLHHPYVEPEIGAGRGLLAALARKACVVVTDDFPCFFLPRMVARAAECVEVRLERIDSNGLLPLRASGEVHPTAYAFRRHLQRTLAAHLEEAPSARPFSGTKIPAPSALPSKILARWPRASERLLAADPDALRALPIDHSVAPAPREGGRRAAMTSLREFVKHRLPRYAERRNELESEVSSGLSPYLHFGHLSPHAVVEAIASAESWTPASLGKEATGKKQGWWGLGANAEAFLDELVTWRELGFNFSSQRADHDRFESLPAWARATLAKHARDQRQHVYSLAELESARTHDELWNAAQKELLVEGRIHNYLRMLWGKKILEWSATPKIALASMIELNNKYALDGRDPNSFSGIFWVLGRYDRPWGPERAIFGTVRYMSSESTRRKLDVDAYVRRYLTAATSGATRSDLRPIARRRAARRASPSSPRPSP